MKLPKNHCMVVHHDYPLAEPRVEREAQALIHRGFQVDVICLREEGEQDFEVVDGVNVYRLPVHRDKSRGSLGQLLEYLYFFTLAFLKLVRLHGKKRYSVVQTHNLPNFLVFAALWPKLTGARVILDIHDLVPEFYSVRFNRDMQSWPVRLTCWEERLSCAFADQVITVTDHWRKALINRGVPADKISIVMNLPDGRIFRRSSKSEKTSQNGNHFHMFYHGNITRRYGLDLAVRAIDLVRKEVPGILLTIQGKGEFHSELVKLVDELDLEEHVHFIPTLVPPSGIPKLLEQADLGVVPYQRDVFTDGILPTKIMEYLALGIPVIAARTPTIEAYFDEKMVQFFTPGCIEELADCILKLSSDRARYLELSENTMRFNQIFDWDEMAANYIALVDRLNSQ